MKIFKMQSAIIFILIFNHCAIRNGVAAQPDSVHYLRSGDVVNNDQPGLRIFCHKANSKYLVDMWKSLTMQLTTKLDSYDLYDGKTPQEVAEKHSENQRSWQLNLFGIKKSRQLKINPFVDTCIGVYIYPSINQQSYTMSVTQARIDTRQLLAMLLGITVFSSAKTLSRNPLFYYICGITFGVSASIAILIYFASKLLPRGKIMYAMMAAGWTMSFYIAQALWENAHLIIMQHTEWIIWYISITSLISFVICYRFGPVTNTRTKKIIQWFLQLSGLATVYYSSYFYEASGTCCVLLFLLYNFPVTVFRRGKNYWKAMFPERRKLLTEDQYRKEGVRETRKALKELQEFCSSPDCNTWKTVLRLKNPVRFAKFMEGDSHLSEDESKEHDAEITRIVEEYEYTDDDDDYDL